MVGKLPHGKPAADRVTCHVAARPISIVPAVTLTVMPTKSLLRAKAGRGLHDVRCCTRRSRGWRAVARHDGLGSARMALWLPILMAW